MNSRAGFWHRLHVRGAVLALASIAFSAPWSMASPTTDPGAASQVDEQSMGDCMLPGRIQRLNNQTVIMGARHPIRTTREDCHVRGGEYHEPDRVAAADAKSAADQAELDRAAQASRTAKTSHTPRHKHARARHTTKVAQSTTSK